MQYRYYLIAVLIAAVLGWVENSHGHMETHDHGPAELITQRLPNGYISGFSKAPPDIQLPGLIRVKMSQDRGVQIGPHRFRPVSGDLRFSLVKGIPERLARAREKSGKTLPEARFFYHVIERSHGIVKESLIDAVSGELIDPQTGEALALPPAQP